MLHSEITQIWTHQMPKLTKKGVVGLIWENIPRVLFTTGLIFISHPHSKTHFLENSENPTQISKQSESYKTSWPPGAYQNQCRTEISKNFQITALKSPQIRGQQINLRDFLKKSDCLNFGHKLSTIMARTVWGKSSILDPYRNTTLRMPKNGH